MERSARIRLEKISSGLGRFSKLGVPGVSAPSAPATRTFVPGEKMWVTKIECKDDGLVFRIISPTPLRRCAYKADPKFFFDDKKGVAMPSAGDMDKMVGSEVFKIQPAEEQTGGGQQPTRRLSEQPRALAPRGRAPVAAPGSGRAAASGRDAPSRRFRPSAALPTRRRVRRRR